VSARPRTERFPGERDLKDRALDAAAEGFSIADLGQPGQPLIYVNQGFERSPATAPMKSSAATAGFCRDRTRIRRRERRSEARSAIAERRWLRS
jgi:hypothetical protein